jgi:hypothetical protein
MDLLPRLPEGRIGVEGWIFWMNPATLRGSIVGSLRRPRRWLLVGSWISILLVGSTRQCLKRWQCHRHLCRIHQRESLGIDVWCWEGPDESLYGCGSTNQFPQGVVRTGTNHTYKVAHLLPIFDLAMNNKQQQISNHHQISIKGNTMG